MLGLQTYLNKIDNYIEEENGNALTSLLSLNGTHVTVIVDQHIEQRQVELVCNKQFEEPWNDIVAKHIQAVVLVYNGDHMLAFDVQKDLVQSFHKGIVNWTRWCLPILYVLNSDLSIIASRADVEAPVGAGERKKLEDAANIISKSFTYCITDRGIMATSKKYGTYHMAGMLFGIYFKLRQQNLCKNIIRAVKTADLPSLDQFPKSDRVTFRYYLGRLYFLEEDYGKAEVELDLAFEECTNTSSKNKGLILQTLLPIKMMRGVLPSQAFFKKFSYFDPVFKAATNAMKDGNVKAFNDAINGSETHLIRQGTYFALEKAESITLRRLFKKVYIIMGSTNKIPIRMFHKALQFEGADVDDLEDTEWKLATLIAKGYIKGYLHHETQYIVLSKQNPFPSLSDVPLSQ